MRRRAEWRLAPVLYAILVAVLYWNVWHDPQGQPTAFGWDVIDSYGPNLEYLSRELASGRWSLWNPYDKGGYPMFCDPQMDRFYPVNWPFMVVGAVLGSPWWLIHLKVLAHRLVAALTMHGFVRSRGGSISGAAVAAVSVLVCVPTLADNVLWPLVWVPLVWMAIDRLTDEPSLGRGAALAAVLYVQGAAGSPPGIFYSLMLTVPYGLWRLAGVLIHAPDGHAVRAYLGRFAPALAFSVLLATSLLAVIWVPTLWFVPQTARVGAIGHDWALAIPLPAWPTLIGMIVPSRGRADAYFGIATLGLAILAVAARSRDDGGIPILFALVGTLGIILSLGDQTPVLPWLVDHVPGFDAWRAPVRYKSLTVFSVCACAGFGTSIVLDRVIARFGRVLGWAVTAMLIAFVPWDVLRISQPDGPIREVRRRHQMDDASLRQFPGLEDTWRIYDEFVYGESVGLRKSVRDFRGYPAVDPLCLRRYVDVLEFARSHPEILEAYNVKWVFRARHFRFGFSQHFLEDRPDVVSPSHFVASPVPGGVPGTFEARHPAPLIVWYGAAREVQDPRDVLAAVLAAEDEGGNRDRAIVESADEEASSVSELKALAAVRPPALPSRAGTLISYRPDRIEAEIAAPAAGMVVLNELWLPGWQATVDGRSAAGLRANYLLRAVMVDAGAHRIVWEFCPPWFRPLKILWGVGMATLLAAWWQGSRMRGSEAVFP